MQPASIPCRNLEFWPDSGHNSGLFAPICATRTAGLHRGHHAHALTERKRAWSAGPGTASRTRRLPVFFRSAYFGRVPPIAVRHVARSIDRLTLAANGQMVMALVGENIGRLMPAGSERAVRVDVDRRPLVVRLAR